MNEKTSFVFNESREEDINMDGKYDLLHFSLQMPIMDKEEIFTLQLLMFFEYRLYVSESWKI